MLRTTKEESLNQKPPFEKDKINTENLIKK